MFKLKIIQLHWSHDDDDFTKFTKSISSVLSFSDEFRISCGTKVELYVHTPPLLFPFLCVCVCVCACRGFTCLYHLTEDVSQHIIIDIVNQYKAAVV